MLNKIGIKICVALLAGIFFVSFLAVARGLDFEPDTFLDHTEPIVYLTHENYDVKMKPIADYLNLDFEPTNKLDRNKNLVKLANELKNEKDVMKTIENCYNWVYKNIEYAETDCKSATCTLELKEGVCRHSAYLLVSLLRVNGIYAKATGFGVYGDPIKHEWVEVYLPGQYPYSYEILPLDPTWGYMGPEHRKTTWTLKQ